jgi:hypothetical protein
MRRHHFEDKEVVFVDQGIVGKATFEVGVTLRNQRRLHAQRRPRCQAEFLELVDFRARGVSDAHHDIGERRRG